MQTGGEGAVREREGGTREQSSHQHNVNKVEQQVKSTYKNDQSHVVTIKHYKFLFINISIYSVTIGKLYHKTQAVYIYIHIKPI